MGGSDGAHTWGHACPSSCLCLPHGVALPRDVTSFLRPFLPDFSLRTFSDINKSGKNSRVDTKDP